MSVVPATVRELNDRLRRFCSQRGMDAALAFKPRPTDTFIAPFAKCGTTWMQQIVHGLRTRGDMDFDEITEVIPWLELAHDMGIDVNKPQTGPFRAFKSHLRWDEIPRGGRYICVLRDPKDALLSLYRFFEGWFFAPGAITLDDFAIHQFVARPPRNSYWGHLISWWPQRRRSNVLMLCYEDMHADISATVVKVAAFLGIDLDSDLHDIVIRQSSMEFMRRHERRFDDHLVRAARDRACGLPPGGRTSKIRNGRVGAHRAALTADLNARMDQVWSERVARVLNIESYCVLRQVLAQEIQ